MLNIRMTETANEHGLEHWSHWCFGFVWSLVIGAWSLVAFIALLGLSGCGRNSPPVVVQPQSGLERAKGILNDYANGVPLGSEAATYEEVVAEVRQTDPSKAAILEKGFADLKRSKQNLRDKARALLKQL